ncbi:MAG: glyoxylase-like metal-dependent hydrolase (beta-lactamase superfamily II) [Yoonia sp.]|jgi:glyoxylase-like metal-dependent hydrolase (beta-lactamase superfamily II)
MAVWPKIAMAQMTVGAKTIHSLSDGFISLPTELVFGPAPKVEADTFIQTHDLTDRLSPPCNVTLLQDGDRNILFDLGAGSEFQSTAGFLLDALDGIDLSPDDITDVVFTHAHPDHIWGLVDDFDDLTFPNAAYMIGQTEWDYWTDPNTVDTIGAERTTFAVGAARRLDRIKDMVTFVKDGMEILPGVAARATFGHTPGHLAFEVRDGTESVMVLGDCIANHHVAFEQPAWRSGSDQDLDTGAATRISLLDQLAQDQMRVVGYHLPGNGIGRVERHAGAYRFVPEI